MEDTHGFFRRASGSARTAGRSPFKAREGIFSIQRVISFARQAAFSALLSAAPAHVLSAEASPAFVTSASPARADTLYWQGDTLTLREVTVSAAFGSSKRDPLRLTTVTGSDLRDRAAARTYPELLRDIPSLYATSESGSYGDARLNIRGFRQENVAVLLNGIPISGLTSGSMYWNNWMGLADATGAIQVQKGIGASMLSDSSVGGSVNIVTASPTEEFSAEAGVYASHYGTVKGYLKYDSGELGKGWGISLMASYVGGKGYVDATDVSSFAYLLSVSKGIGEHNSLLFTALGSPEKHAQRSSRLSADEVAAYGIRYNRDWGYRDGKEFNLNLNNYFKPYFTLQHLYSRGPLTMNNSLYLAVGNGGGRWNESKSTPISSYRTADGQLDWDAVVAANSASGTASAAYDASSAASGGLLSESGVSGEGTAAMNILSDYLAGHTQAGAIVSACVALTERWTLDAGAHYQFYSTWEKERITDLLGADYWYEDYGNSSLAGLAGRDPIKHVGDYVRTDNGKVINHGTLYAAAKYASPRVTLNLGVSGFFSSCRRWDRYNYVGGDVYSDAAWGAGFSVKAGVLFKVASHSSIYLNGGYYSRLPYSDVWFSSGNNEITEGVKNERNILSELGYRFVYARGGAEVTAYAAYWKNRTLMSDPYKAMDRDQTRYMMTGLDAFHYGIELETFHNFTRWMKLTAFASIGDWRWKNDVHATIYDGYSGLPVSEVNVYSDGLPVGDAPQTQVGAGLEFKLPAGFRITAGWRFNDRMYADFEPEDRTAPDDRSDPYRIPGYHLIDASVNWSREFPKLLSMTVFVSGANLLDTFYVERAVDGAAHDLASLRGFWGFGRNFSFGLRLSFR